MTQQAPIEIPLVKSLAEVGDPCENIVATLHFLLGALMSRGEALLHAEWLRPAEEVTWFLRSRDGGKEGADESLAVLPSAVSHSCISRLALITNLSYITGGRSQATLIQHGHRHACSIYLSNCKESGSWIRVYGSSV